MDPDSLTEYVTHQGELLTRMARQAEASGFCIITHGVNPHTHNSRLYNFLAGGYGDMFDTWCRTHGRKYVRINVWFTSPIPPTGPLTASVCLWKFEIPRTKRMRPIVVGLDLVCDHLTGYFNKYQIQQACMAARRPITVQRSDRHEYQGKDHLGLELALGILKMEPHREILTDRYTPKLPLKR